jgi:hypothetical protein
VIELSQNTYHQFHHEPAKLLDSVCRTFL